MTDSGVQTPHAARTDGTGSSLSRRLAELALQLHRHRDPQDVLDGIVTAAVALVPGAREATITQVRRRQVVSAVAATSPGAGSFDALQQELGEGPCLDALFTEPLVRVDDLAADTRWPALARRAPDVGVASAVCVRLYVAGDNLGALNLLAPNPGAFDEEAEDVGQLLASHAAIAVAGTQEVANVRAALDSRDLIGQAKGILMARHKLTAEQAFAVLTRYSQDTNRKLRDVAADVAATGHLE
ncbi:GAF and ANTAR domain-containing protein [Kineococcus sp. LSe6-4]|uniref:GAF and ANTAR domain-containing protein n=1 Tax=Kineococcus halophytocola TaxID=3234027 RepID=A0ABV4GYP3_9ACTN